MRYLPELHHRTTESSRSRGKRDLPGDGVTTGRVRAMTQIVDY